VADVLEQNQRSLNDLSDLINEKLLWLSVARELLTENGLLDEFKKRVKSRK
jgi:hypothetical protein